MLSGSLIIEIHVQEHFFKLAQQTDSNAQYF